LFGFGYDLFFLRSTASRLVVSPIVVGMSSLLVGGAFAYANYRHGLSGVTEPSQESTPSGQFSILSRDDFGHNIRSFLSTWSQPGITLSINGNTLVMKIRPFDLGNEEFEKINIQIPQGVP
jgi:hypothetical protein